MNSPLIPVLMCGGAGTRLWPVSRESMPKQFVPLIGDRSTFQQTLQRVADSTVFARPIVITHTDFRFIVAEQLREIGIDEPGPIGTNTTQAGWLIVESQNRAVANKTEFPDAARSAVAGYAKGKAPLLPRDMQLKPPVAVLLQQEMKRAFITVWQNPKSCNRLLPRGQELMRLTIKVTG